MTEDDGEKSEKELIEERIDENINEIVKKSSNTPRKEDRDSGGEVNYANLDSIIEKSFWKDVLLEVISDLNPWDIDILELATRYSKKVEQMKEINFKIPANVIIVSSVLLRMKSDLLTFSGPDLEYDLEEWISDGVFVDGFNTMGESTQNNKGCNKIEDSITNIDIDPRVPIQVKPKRVPKRRITAMELISAIQEVLEDKERLKIKKEKKKESENNDNIIVSPKFDIKRLIHETYLRIMEVLLKRNVAKFSEIIKKESREDIVGVLISLLHLSNDKKIRLKQGKMYGEIMIHPFQNEGKKY